MPDNTSNSVQLQLGLVMDLHALAAKKGAWRYAMGVNVESLDGEGIPLPQNEHSNFLSVLFPAGYSVISHKVIKELDRILYFLVNPVTNVSIIGEVAVTPCYTANTADEFVRATCKDCGGYQMIEPVGVEKQSLKACASFNIITTSSCLNLSIFDPIDIEYKLTNCDLRLYLTDNRNPRRFLYLEIVGQRLKMKKEFCQITGYDSACGTPIYDETVLDCNKMLVQPKISRGAAIVHDIISGGHCQAGLYQFFVCYADISGNQLSEYFPGTNPIPIHSRTVVLQDDLPTDKGVLLDISGMDYSSYYRYYNLAVVRTVNGGTSFYKVTTQPIASKSYFYTDAVSDYISIDENAILKRPAYYEKAGFVTSSNGILYWGIMQEFAKGNWQRMANMIRIYWQTTQIPIGSYANPKMAEKYRSLMRDEVVALGVVIEFDNGEESPYLHIPGRVSNPTDKDSITIADQFTPEGCDATGFNESWRAYNTATVMEAPHEQYDPCNDTIWEWGEFGYWESSEKYPDNESVWGELRCQPIRHHKVPSAEISALHDGLNDNNPYERKVMVYPVGLRVDHDSVRAAIQYAQAQGFITQAMVDRITGYRIVRGDRYGNQSIEAKGLLYDCFSYDRDSKKYYYPNYPFNDVRDDPYISNNPDTYKKSDSSISDYKNQFENTGRYTFHSPDTHFRNPQIGSELKVESVAYGESEGWFSLMQDHPRYKFMSAFSYILSTGVGLAAALSHNKESKRTMIKKGPTDVFSALGLASGAALATPLPGFLNPVNISTPFFDYQNALAGLDLVSTEEHKEVSTGRMRDFLPTISLNPWRAGLFVGPHPILDINPLFLPLTLMLGAPRLLWNFANAFVEIDRFLSTIETLVPNKNMAWQYQAIAKYNNFKIPDEGNRRRKIVDYAYLTPNVLTIPEEDASGSSQTIHFNNYQRESALFLKIKDTLPTASTYSPDDSRYLCSEAGMCDDPNQHVRRKVCSYYASLKNTRTDLYGNIYDIRYLELGHPSFIYNETTINPVDRTTVFGGDTFICEMSLKRKHSFFTTTAYGLLDNADFKYSERGNAGYPNFYFNSKEPLTERLSETHDTVIDILLSKQGVLDILGVPRNRYDCDKNGMFYQGGMIYMSSYGIPCFVCESTINVDLRTARDTKAGDFYPRQQDLDYWLQEKYVSIREDNQYHYNKDYSLQNDYAKGDTTSPEFEPNKACVVTRRNMMVYAADETSGDDSSSTVDRWLQNLVADAYEFPLSDGVLVSADGIENEKVLVRFHDTMRAYNSFIEINTSAEKAIISQGDIFKSKPQEFSKTDIGHLGTRHKAILHTEFGHVTLDCDRGNIFLIAPNNAGLDDLAKYGNEQWFKQNLPFQIKKDFPKMDDKYIDNAYRGIGIAMGYDKRFKRLLLTKLDYKCLNKDIVFSNGEFMLGTTRVDLNDGRYFCNKSWTLTFRLDIKLWLSFMPFVPNFYTGFNDFFQLGINIPYRSQQKGSVWSHLLTNKSYQVFFGKITPFEIQALSEQHPIYSILEYIEFKAEFWRFHTEYDKFLKQDVTFSKALVFTDRQCSAPLYLDIQTDDYSIRYPHVDSDERGIHIRTDYRSGVWSINHLYDYSASQYNNIPLMVTNCGNYKAVVNRGALDLHKQKLPRLRSEQFSIRLTNDTYSNYKIILHWINFYTSQSHV